ncbi:conserved hypothetical protein (plasmid) [Thermomicrobium roseum DSM 5159]|uniref:Uncharacterized protein n=1 Tax=Thermomicrobium roseum (strain ATCC 27502 / DSM 5159 / P-2) TaxID=309801 RepID=B9L441_THERP|nr:conserved hypothetical protein [Thermomicrobium roseum DSM 5159]
MSALASLTDLSAALGAPASEPLPLDCIGLYERSGEVPCRRPLLPTAQRRAARLRRPFRVNSHRGADRRWLAFAMHVSLLLPAHRRAGLGTTAASELFVDRPANSISGTPRAPLVVKPVSIQGR